MVRKRKKATVKKGRNTAPGFKALDPQFFTMLLLSNTLFRILIHGLSLLFTQLRARRSLLSRVHTDTQLLYNLHFELNFEF